MAFCTLLEWDDEAVRPPMSPRPPREDELTL
jgi:hypothetical protein